MTHMPATDQPDGATLVADTRLISTSGGLIGGGDLSADRTLSIEDGGVTLVKLAAMMFGADTRGLVPSSGGGTDNFLRADGTWAEPPGAGTTGLYYNVLDHGFVADGTTDNRAALRTLWATVLAAGGGTIYFPSGDYYFAVGSAGDRNQLNLSNTGVCNIRFLGDGPSSRWIWGGDAGTANVYIFNIGGNFSYIRM
jgi:hypothetical protein